MAFAATAAFGVVVAAQAVDDVGQAVVEEGFGCGGSTLQIV